MRAKLSESRSFAAAANDGACWLTRPSRRKAMAALSAREDSSSMMRICGVIIFMVFWGELGRTGPCFGKFQKSLN